MSHTQISCTDSECFTQQATLTNQECWNHFPGEPVNDKLVGDHHDGGVGDLPAELGHHAAVESPPPLLAVHQEDRLPELAVPWVALAQARTGNLCKPKKEAMSRNR